MRGYPQFSFWILIALAKIWFFHSHKPSKNTFASVGKFLKILDFLHSSLGISKSPIQSFSDEEYATEKDDKQKQ